MNRMLAAMMCGLSALGGAVSGAAGQPLPTDPAYVTGRLDNGLSYVVRKNSNPQGRVIIYLHVQTGSLNETDAIRGISHYLEHMAFNGSKNFAPGTLVPFFQSLGLQFGRDQNAFTNLQQTTYQLTLPNTNAETIDKALLFFSDVAGRLNLAAEEVEAERKIILEERRRGLGPEQRVGDYVRERIAPESAWARRMTIGAEETIKSVQRGDFVAYYGKWYVPSNITLLAVGDVDPQAIIEGVKKNFADLPSAPRPARMDIGVKPQTETRGIVATDPELKTASLDIVHIEPARGASKTEQDFRRDLVESFATRAFGRRIGNEQAKGGTVWQSLSASAGNVSGAMREISVSASGKPENWRAMLTEMGVHVQRARLHGFTDAEIEDARVATIAAAEQAASRESTAASAALIGRVDRALNDGEPVMSASQRLELLKRIAPTITAQEASEWFAKTFAMTSASYVITMPTGGDVPTESDLVHAGQAAWNVKPAPIVEAARASSLLSTLPKGGTVAEEASDAASGVWSGWLSNGVRIHHKFNDQTKNQASISITLAGGEILETAANRGISDAAHLAFSRPATSTLSSTQIRDFMTGKKVNVGGGGGFGGGGGGRGGGGGGGAGPDSFTLSISGDPEALETGFQLAYLILTDAVIEKAALEQWKERQVQGIARRKITAGGVMADAVAEALYPKDEARTRALTEEQVNRITLESAQAWLKDMLGKAPIEVAVVGDISREKAVELVARYLGSLSARGRINGALFADRRVIKRPVGPISVERSVETRTPQAIAMDGFFGADSRNIPDVRRLSMAARILSSRMVKTIREEKQLVYSISASSTPATVFPGYGMFVAQAPCDPANGAALAAALEEMYAEFAKNGPTEDEMVVAKKQFAQTFETEMKTPAYWAGQLSAMDYRGRNLKDAMEAPGAYQAMTAKQVQETFAKYFKPEARVRFVVTPKPPAPTDKAG